MLPFLAVLVISAPAGELAVTMDDFDASDKTRISGDERNDAILQALARHHAHAALFVSCKNLRGPADWKRLDAWVKSGQMIANHSFSHLMYDATLSTAAEEKDIQRCDDILAKVKGYKRRFRYPFLQEGDTETKRDDLRAWLKGHGFESGAVTIDASDWYVDQRLRERLAKDPSANVDGYRDYYLQHMWSRAEYYDQLARDVLGRPVKHTLLVHFNLLNALFLDDLLTMFESHGWKVIDASTAFADAIFATAPNGMPAGQGIIWQHANAAGRDVRYPAEDGRYEKDAMDKLGL
jgi:peptidoglycan/xylan/chitin deacetylase (PgdA/CDA1 family)